MFKIILTLAFGASWSVVAWAIAEYQLSHPHGLGAALSTLALFAVTALTAVILASVKSLD